MELTVKQIVEAVGGTWLNPSAVSLKITAITTDSRALVKDSLFIPLRGDRFDGHSFIPHLFDAGVTATLTMIEEVVDPRLATIYVADTRKALLDLGNYYRKLFDVPVIGVTGSVGKTSTKEIIAAVLSGKFKVHKTEGNFNNEIGLPLTLFKLEQKHEVAVIEMGMNHFGEIHNLSVCAEPDMAIITNIGTSHIENLGSREGILQAKLEIRDGLKVDGKLIVCGDNDLLGALEDNEQTIFYGFDEKMPYRAIDIICDKDCTHARVISPIRTYDLTIYALGEHMIYNTLAAVAVAEQFGLTEEEIKQGLLSYEGIKGRMHIETYDNGITTMDDTYNASTDSMKASLKVLKDYKSVGRKIAVLGDMLEMGDFAVELHQEVGEVAALLELDLICSVGTLARYIDEGCRKHKGTKCIYYKTKEEWMQEASKWLQRGDIILFKASRGMHFEEMLEAVRKVK